MNEKWTMEPHGEFMALYSGRDSQHHGMRLMSLSDGGQCFGHYCKLICAIPEMTALHKAVILRMNHESQCDCQGSGTPACEVRDELNKAIRVASAAVTIAFHGLHSPPTAKPDELPGAVNQWYEPCGVVDEVEHCKCTRNKGHSGAHRGMTPHASIQWPQGPVVKPRCQAVGDNGQCNLAGDHTGGHMYYEGLSAYVWYDKILTMCGAKISGMDGNMPFAHYCTLPKGHLYDHLTDTAVWPNTEQPS